MTGRTLLLVEDQFIVATVEKNALERCGYTVLVAHSEAAAIGLCRAHPEIDLILMDVDLGTDRDGIDAAASILNECDLPIVFLSIHTEPEMVERTERITSYGYVLKNAGIAVLNASIKMALQLCAERQQVREQQRQLQQSAANLAAVLESNADLVWAIDQSYALLYANTHFLWAAETWYGMIVRPGENLLRQIPQAWRNDWQQRYDRVFAGGHLKEIITVERQSGVGHLEIHGHAMTVQGQVTGASFSAKDVTTRKRAEETLRRSVQTERILLRELRHRAKNSLSLISAMITLTGAVPGSPETAAALGKVHARVLAIAGMYDQLDAHESTTTLRLDEYLCRIVPALLGASGSITLDCACEPIIVPVDIASPLGLIITELVTNAVKHAFPKPRTGRISVTIQQVEGTLHLDCTDNGVGVPDGFDLAATNSLGLRIVQKLIEQIQGRMTVSRNEGTRYRIRVPHQHIAEEGPPEDAPAVADPDTLDEGFGVSQTIQPERNGSRAAIP